MLQPSSLSLVMPDVLSEATALAPCANACQTVKLKMTQSKNKLDLIKIDPILAYAYLPRSHLCDLHGGVKHCHRHAWAARLHLGSGAVRARPRGVGRAGVRRTLRG